jgi:hypothetical protein
MEQPGILEQLRRLGAQRRAREVLIAVVLTIAAFAFLASAIFGKDAVGDGSVSAQSEAHYETVVKHQPQ